MRLFTYTGRFAILSSGTCGSKGLYVISTKSDCENAAIDLNLSDTSANVVEPRSAPSGCIWSTSYSWLGLNIKFNSDVPCGSDTDATGKSTYSCICSPGKFKYFYTWKQS